MSQVKGYTAAWAAPEVLEKGDRVTSEADIFAYGMVMIEVGPCPSTDLVSEVDGSPDIWFPVKGFTGGYPFSGFTTPVIVSMIMDGKRPARPREAQKLGLTDRVWNMMLKCWKRDPAHRPTVMEVVGLLREWSVFSLSMEPKP